jgi:hypothetical protein
MLVLSIHIWTRSSAVRTSLAAARIEPVTTPGCAYASEQFAALVAVECGDDFVCDYVGVEDLAKGYDRCPLYRLRRRV